MTPASEADNNFCRGESCFAPPTPNTPSTPNSRSPFLAHHPAAPLLQNILVDLYETWNRKNLSEYDVITFLQVKFKDFQYCLVRKHMCHLKQHNQCDCNSMIQAANHVLNEGITPLSHVFKLFFPHVTYHARNAKRRMLQMPVVALRVRGELYLIEKVEGLNYTSLTDFLSK